MPSNTPPAMDGSGSRPGMSATGLRSKSRIQELEFRPKNKRRFLSPFNTSRRPAWTARKAPAWAWRLLKGLSRPTGESCGWKAGKGRAPLFRLSCRRKEEEREKHEKKRTGRKPQKEDF